MVLTRRGFLKTSLGASALLSLSPTANPGAFAAGSRSGSGDTVLVVIQLAGGNDGLNTVIPYEDDEYAKNRPTLRFTADEVHKIDSGLGFHPEMETFAELYKEGYLSVVQGVGYPNSYKDHADAMRAWHTARPDRLQCQTGWVGRAADYGCNQCGLDVPVVFVSEIAQPFSLNAETAIIPSVDRLEDCALRTLSDSGGEQPCRENMTELARLPRARMDNPLVDFLKKRTLDAHKYNKRIEAVLQSNATSVEYPPYQLAERLKTIAQLIRADVGIRILHTELGGAGFGGFDNHANQRGNHGALLRQLSDSVAAFVEDLQRDRLLGRVLLMTFSEFGRTVKENGRRGTGHGAAAPMFLVGGQLAGGLIGPHPSLSDPDDGGALKFHTDFRQVFATALDCWLGFDSRTILGDRYEAVDMLRV